MDQKELENRLNENMKKERRTLAFLSTMLKMVRADVTATETWQQKFNEKFNFTPPRSERCVHRPAHHLREYPERAAKGPYQSAHRPLFQYFGNVKAETLHR